MPASCTLKRRCRPSNIRTSRYHRVRRARHICFIVILFTHRFAAALSPFARWPPPTPPPSSRSGDARAKIISSCIYPLFGARRRPVNNTVACTPSAAFRFAGPPPGSRCYRVVVAGPVTVARLIAIYRNRVCLKKKDKTPFLFAGVYSPPPTDRFRAAAAHSTDANGPDAPKWRPSRPASPPEPTTAAGRTCQPPWRSFATGTTTRRPTAPRGRGDIPLYPGSVRVNVCVCGKERTRKFFGFFFTTAPPS